MYREKRKERRACTYEAAVKGGGSMHCTDQKRKERRLCTYESVVRGACTERKGKRGGHVHIGSCGEGGGMYCTERKGKRGDYVHMKLW